MGKKLLVADDSVTIQKVIKLALSSEGYDILAVSEGKEAIRAIQQEMPDVVLIDVALPGADAYEVKKAINENPKLASIGFVLMASAFERVDEKSVDEFGFHGRLIKPFDPSHLRKAVSDLMQKPPAPRAPQVTQEVSSPPTPPPPADEPQFNASGLDATPIATSPIATSNASIEIETPIEIFAPPQSNVSQAASNAFTSSASSSISTPPPTPPAPPIEEEDFPQVQDEHPTLLEEPIAINVSEAEFNLPSEPLAFVPPPPSAPLIESEDEDADKAEEANERALESDIKDLTESTIKLSGLDEFQWNLDDSKKMKLEDSSIEEKTVELKRPSPQKGIVQPPPKPIDDGGSSFPIKPAAPIPPPGSDLISGKDFVRPVSTTEPAKAAPLPMSRDEMEEIIRKQVEDAIQRLARDSVPEIAEAIIRKEIEKVLSEP